MEHFSDTMIGRNLQHWLNGRKSLFEENEMKIEIVIVYTELAMFPKNDYCLLDNIMSLKIYCKLICNY